MYSIFTFLRRERESEKETKEKKRIESYTIERNRMTENNEKSNSYLHMINVRIANVDSHPECVCVCVCRFYIFWFVNNSSNIYSTFNCIRSFRSFVRYRSSFYSSLCPRIIATFHTAYITYIFTYHNRAHRIWFFFR